MHNGFRFDPLAGIAAMSVDDFDKTRNSLEQLKTTYNEAKADIPELKPITIQAGAIIGQKLDHQTGKSNPIYYTQDDVLHEAQKNAAQYIKECQEFFNKWFGAK
jgi:hypothetical protein